MLKTELSNKDVWTWIFTALEAVFFFFLFKSSDYVNVLSRGGDEEEEWKRAGLNLAETNKSTFVLRLNYLRRLRTRLLYI